MDGLHLLTSINVSSKAEVNEKVVIRKSFYMNKVYSITEIVQTYRLQTSILDRVPTK